MATVDFAGEFGAISKNARQFPSTSAIPGLLRCRPQPHFLPLNASFFLLLGMDTAGRLYEKSEVFCRFPRGNRLTIVMYQMTVVMYQMTIRSRTHGYIGR